MIKYFSGVPLRLTSYFSIGNKKIICRKLPLAFIIIFITVIQSFISKNISAQGVTFSYSYFNITRNTTGGTLQTGDVIEIHALAYVPTGTTISDFYFTDSIRTGMQYVPSSMNIQTNEGVVVSGSMTDKTNDDQAVYDATTVPTRIRINLSSGFANAQSGANYSLTTGGGTCVGGSVPKAGSGTLAIVAYQVTITASFGDTLWLGGNFYYTLAGIANKYHFNYYGVKVVQNQTLCANSSSASFTAESSFGSGTTQNRTAGVNAPGFTKVNIGANQPADNYYSVVNNTSATGATNNTVPYAPTASPTRVFGGYWDIIGDHTGAANTATGNPPVAPGTNGGYLLAVNANYTTGLAYTDTIKNLCPNTYYEFSAWIRNICGVCGEDKNGNQEYTPGVLPNLAYGVNGVDYYTTGNIAYTATWVQRGFIYQTGPTETSFIISIKNNASGGGGNDWVLDDINFSTCYPNLTMNPSDTASVCAGYPIVITDTVRSYYNTYSFYQWQASVNGGVTWVNVGSPGTGVPVLVNGLYQYTESYDYTPASIDSGHYIRILVATTLSNLTNPNCAVANSQKVFLKVYSTSCSALNANIINFSGSVINKQNVLQWTVGDPDNIEDYVLEKSTDAVHFSQDDIVQQGVADNSYTFTDPDITSSLNYYRLKILSKDNSPAVYSKTVALYNRSTTVFQVSAVNPFYDNLKVEVVLPIQGKVQMNLFDMYGNILSKKTLQLSAGNSQVTIDNVSNLPGGMYILTTNFNGSLVQNKLIKSN